MHDAHRRLRESLGAYLAGHLSPDERAEVEHHLASCPACRAELDQIGPVVSLLRSHAVLATSMAPPPRHLEQHVMARVSAASRQHVTQASPTPIGRGRRSPRTTAWLGLVAAASFVLFVAGLGAGWALTRPPSGPPTEPIIFAAVPAGIEADGRLVAHTWGTEIRLVVAGLEPDETYRVEMQGVDGTAHDAGTFIGVADRPIVCSLNAAVLRDDVRRVSILDASGQPVLEADVRPT